MWISSLALVGCAWISASEHEERLDSDSPVDTDCAPSLWFVDADGDGHGAGAGETSCPPEGAASVGGDCADGDPAVHPGVVDDDCDGEDDDCDDRDDEDAVGGPWFTDADGDDWGDPATETSGCGFADAVSQGGDCDDTDAEVSPGATEECENGVDDDCDGLAGVACRPTGVTGLAAANLTITDTTAGIGWGIAVGDYNGDGVPDLVTQGVSSHRVYLFPGPFSERKLTLGDAIALFPTDDAYPVAYAAFIADAGDRDHDGNPELLVVDDAEGQGQIRVYEAPLSATSTPIAVYSGMDEGSCLGCVNNGLPRPGVVPVGDFDDDGADDLAAVSIGDGVGGVLYLLSGAKTGETTSADAIGSLAGEAYDTLSPPVAAAGYNGDDYADVAVFADTQDLAYLFLGGKSHFDTSLGADATLDSTAKNDFGAALAHCADIGDGTSAMAVGTYGTGGFDALVGLMPLDLPGYVNLESQAIATFGPYGWIYDMACDDLDGDGLSDLVVGRWESAHDIVVTYGPLVDRGPTDFDWQVGSGPILPIVVGDLNDDGVSDIVHSDYFGGNVYVYFGGGF